MQLKDIPSTAAQNAGAADQAKPRQRQQKKKPASPGNVQSAAPVPNNLQAKAGPEEDKKSKQALSTGELEQALESIREYAGWGNFDIGFEEDDETNATVVKIVDRETGETLKQIPPEEILQVKSQIRKTLGLIFDHLA